MHHPRRLHKVSEEIPDSGNQVNRATVVEQEFGTFDAVVARNVEFGRRGGK